jgi:hypothetical protein
MNKNFETKAGEVFPSFIIVLMVFVASSSALLYNNTLPSSVQDSNSCSREGQVQRANPRILVAAQLSSTSRVIIIIAPPLKDIWKFILELLLLVDEKEDAQCTGTSLV